MSWFGLLSLVYLLLYIAEAEWIEIPQFSDRHRVYRMPQPTSRPYSRPYYHHPTISQQNSHRRIYVAGDRYDGHHQDDFHHGGSLRNISKFTGNRHSIYPNGEHSFPGTSSTFTTERIISSVSAGIETIDPDDGVVLESIEDNEPQLEEIPVLYSSIEDVTTTFKSNTAVPIQSSTQPTKSSKPPPASNETENDKGFFDYLPVDLLKRVHKTLKSQPPTLKGKIRFLKAFERTLVQEIENRLSKALAPTRKTRGARGHDDHSDGIGFPSLEGSLMAISFLTFAVYLIRLVMMLFRNAGNGTPPILIGRKKRSIDEYGEQAARILNYLDSNSAEYYKSQKQFAYLNKHFDSRNARNHL